MELSLGREGSTIKKEDRVAFVDYCNQFYRLKNELAFGIEDECGLLRRSVWHGDGEDNPSCIIDQLADGVN